MLLLGSSMIYCPLDIELGLRVKMREFKFCQKNNNNNKKFLSTVEPPRIFFFNFLYLSLPNIYTHEPSSSYQRCSHKLTPHLLI